MSNYYLINALNTAPYTAGAVRVAQWCTVAACCSMMRGAASAAAWCAVEHTDAYLLELSN